jgi:hypothetical protein
VVTSGSSVVWNSFQVAPRQSASARITVSFTPTAAQVGSQVVLSEGISAEAVDLVTGQRFSTSYGSLATQVRVQAAGSTTKPAGGPAPASAPAPTTSSSPGVSGLPTTGGAATMPRPVGLIAGQRSHVMRTR